MKSKCNQLTFLSTLFIPHLIRNKLIIKIKVRTILPRGNHLGVNLNILSVPFLITLNHNSETVNHGSILEVGTRAQESKKNKLARKILKLSSNVDPHFAGK